MTVQLQLSELVPNTWYRFTHTRKKQFTGIFLEYDVEAPTDPEQPPEYYITVDIHTAPGELGAHIARTAWYHPETGLKHPSPEFTRCKLLAQFITDVVPLVPES